MTVIPTIDLQPFATGASPSSVEAVRVAAEIDAALHEVGFLLVTGHGIDPGVKDALFERMRAFFSLPLDAKEALAIGKSDCHRGYVGTAAEALDGVLGTGEDPIDTPPAGDLKETLDTGTEHGPDHPEVLAGTPLHGANQLPPATTQTQAATSVTYPLMLLARPRRHHVRRLTRRVRGCDPGLLAGTRRGATVGEWTGEARRRRPPTVTSASAAVARTAT